MACHSKERHAFKPAAPTGFLGSRLMLVTHRRFVFRLNNLLDRKKAGEKLV
jgi:hypothetical protein